MIESTALSAKLIHFPSIMKFSVLFVLALSGITLAQDGKEPRFSIGLGVLAPSYSQKLAGNGRLDVDQNKNGFSYTLNNVPHPSSGSSASYQVLIFY